MKKASELGLQVIELEDQVLLVDRKQKLSKGDWHIEKDRIINQFPNYLTDLNECSKIIFSTKPLEGLPLLVIEDEVEKMADEKFPEDGMHNNRMWQAIGFVKGYNKAKETYKFTEEDLMKAIDMARKFPANSSYFPLYTTDEIIQSLTKKELWIEVEEVISHFDIGYAPEIENGKLKAIWK